MTTDQNSTSASETPNDVTSTGETPNTSATSETLETTTSSDDLSKELERLKTSLKRANAEAKQYREKATELDALKSKDLSESERLQREIAELKAQQEERAQAQFEQNIRTSVSLEAAKLGVDPNVLDRVARFLDWEEIEVNDDGQPTNIRALVEALVKEIPGLKARSAQTPTSSGGATNPSRSQSDAGSGEITASYVADIMSGRIAWQSLTPERRSAVMNWQAKNAYRF